MTYVNLACDSCHRLVPGNETHQITQEIQVGRTSGTTRRYASGRYGYTTGSRTFKTERLTLCGDCYTTYLEAHRRQKQAARRAALLLFSAVVLIAIVVALLATGHRNQGASLSKDVAPSAVLNSATEDVAPAPREVGNEANVVEPPAATPENESTAATDTAPPPAADAPLAGATSSPTPENTPALSTAVSAALNAGAPTTWQSGAFHGTVTVGEETLYHNKPCRQFGYTVDDIRSGLTIACRSPDGVWRPEER